ncbi:MAG: hypothetical protein BWY88_00611 [Synergistetes bacterium ADurb.Bin520]|nr:MAG: hypothetical protein BWY88_00611 [Synergistetes bacterium ADurb.Bin520]
MGPPGRAVDREGPGIGRGQDDPHLHKPREVVPAVVGARDIPHAVGFLGPEHALAARIGLHDPVEGLRGAQAQDEQDQGFDAPSGVEGPHEAEKEEAIDDPAHQGLADGKHVGRQGVPQALHRCGIRGTRRGHAVVAHHLGLRGEPEEQGPREGRHLQDEEHHKAEKQGEHPRPGKAQGPPAVLLSDEVLPQEQQGRRQNHQGKKGKTPGVHGPEQDRPRRDHNQIEAIRNLFHTLLLGQLGTEPLFPGRHMLKMK